MTARQNLVGQYVVELYRDGTLRQDMSKAIVAREAAGAFVRDLAQALAAAFARAPMLDGIATAQAFLDRLRVVLGG